MPPHHILIIDMLPDPFGKHKVKIILWAGQPPFLEFGDDRGAKINFPFRGLSFWGEKPPLVKGALDIDLASLPSQYPPT